MSKKTDPAYPTVDQLRRLIVLLNELNSGDPITDEITNIGTFNGLAAVWISTPGEYMPVMFQFCPHSDTIYMNGDTRW